MRISDWSSDVCSSDLWDRVYVTTLFSFEYRKIGETIDYALKLVGGRADRVFVGGIAASLMTERVTTEARWRGVRFISRSEERCVGQECVSTCRNRCAPEYQKKNQQISHSTHESTTS